MTGVAPLSAVIFEVLFHVREFASVRCFVNFRVVIAVHYHKILTVDYSGPAFWRCVRHLWHSLVDLVILHVLEKVGLPEEVSVQPVELVTEHDLNARPCLNGLGQLFKEEVKEKLVSVAQHALLGCVLEWEAVLTCLLQEGPDHMVDEVVKFLVGERMSQINEDVVDQAFCDVVHKVKNHLVFHFLRPYINIFLLWP